LLSRFGVAVLNAFEDARDLGHEGSLPDGDRMSIAEKKTQGQSSGTLTPSDPVGFFRMHALEL